jgi:hypothetical protein
LIQEPAAFNSKKQQRCFSAGFFLCQLLLLPLQEIGLLLGAGAPSPVLSARAGALLIEPGIDLSSYDGGPIPVDVASQVAHVGSQRLGQILLSGGG